MVFQHQSFPKEKASLNVGRKSFEILLTVKPAHSGQLRSHPKSTVRSRWPLRATATSETFFPNNRKKKSA